MLISYLNSLLYFLDEYFLDESFKINFTFAWSSLFLVKLNTSFLFCSSITKIISNSLKSFSLNWRALRWLIAIPFLAAFSNHLLDSIILFLYYMRLNKTNKSGKSKTLEHNHDTVLKKKNSHIGKNSQKSCAHPSHSRMSCLLNSSLSLRVSGSFCRAPQCMRGV